MREFIRNVGSNYVVYGLQLLISIIAIPVYLAAYGDQLYGVYLLSLGLAQSLLFLEFGSGKAMLRYTAVFLTDKNELNYGRALRTCSLITFVSALLVGLIFAILLLLRNQFFEIPAELDRESFWLFTGAGVYSILLIVAQIPASLIKGAGLFYHRNILVLFQLAVRIALVVILFVWGMSIIWLLVGELLILILTLIFDYLILAKKATELLRIDLLSNPVAEPYLDRSVYGYAKDTFKLSVVGFFSQNVDKLIIGFFLSVDMVTVYTIITKPYQVIKTLLSKVYVVLQPTYVRLYSKGERESLVEFTASSGGVLSWLMFPFLAVSMLLFPWIVEQWLGTDAYAPYIIYGQILLAATGCRTLTTMLYQAIYVTGGADRLFRLEVLLVGINFSVSVLLVHFVGVGGVLIGTAVQLLLIIVLILPVATSFLRLKEYDVAIASIRKNFFWLSFVYFITISLVLVIPHTVDVGSQFSYYLIIGITVFIVSLAFAVYHRDSLNEIFNKTRDSVVGVIEK